MQKTLFKMVSILSVLSSVFGMAAVAAPLSINKILAQKIEGQIPQSILRISANLNHDSIASGAVIASPSQAEPNYFFHWSRDAALSVRVFTDALEGKNTFFDKMAAETQLWRWVSFESHLQTLSAPAGLGEPKFNTDGTIFDGPWGRPQNDGPALRAVTMMRFANYLLKKNRAHEVEAYLYPVIKNDLDYTTTHWREGSFDLWEEIKGDHFYTRMAQWKAMRMGSKFFENRKARDKARTYLNTASDIASALQSHFDTHNQIIFPTLNQTDGWNHKFSHMDIAVILAYLHSTENGDRFSIQDPIVQNYARKLASAFAFYEINRGESNLAPAIGRYPEDVYDGNGFGHGHPWFLATFAMAEFNCRNGTSPNAFLARGLFHAGRDGNLQEQYSRFNGYMRGARDLTWSHVSFLTALTECRHSLRNFF
ncbi:MAG: glycoside hydrolase family 15 protein [Pseudobdellovibrionaceae bacterium]